MSCLLGFDYGRKRVGVAVGQRITASASPLAVLAHTGTNGLIDEIGKLIALWRPEQLIIGLPLTAEGDEQPMTRHARQFGDALQKRFQMPIVWVDERYTSRAVSEDFRSARALGNARKKHAERLDAHAAQRILEQYLRG